MFFVIPHIIKRSSTPLTTRSFSISLAGRRPGLCQIICISYYVLPLHSIRWDWVVFPFASISWLPLSFLSSSLNSSHLFIVLTPVLNIQTFFLLVGTSCSAPSVLPSPASICSQLASGQPSKRASPPPTLLTKLCLPFHPLGLESSTEPSPWYFSYKKIPWLGHIKCPVSTSVLSHGDRVLPEITP